jgi:signal transduction histidine kinase
VQLDATETPAPPLPPLGAAEAERELTRLRRAERIILAIRWVVMIAWLPIFQGGELPVDRSNIYYVHAAVAAYTAVTHYLVWRGRSILATAVITTIGDSTAVALMCLFTRGIYSDIYPYFYLHLLTTSIRFGMRETFLVLAQDVFYSLLLYAFAPPVLPRDLALRVFYLFFVALIAGVLSRDARTYYRRALKEGDKASLLLSVNREITSTLDLADLLSRILREVLSAIRCRGACIVLLDRALRKPERVVVAGEFPPLEIGDVEESLASGVLRRTLDQGMVVLNTLDDVRASVRCTPMRRFVSRNLAVFSMRRRDVLGFLVVADHRSGDFSADDVGLLSTVADQAGVAIENARLVEDVLEARDRRQQLLWRLIHAEEDERKRIAGDVHDRMGQRCYELYYQIGRCRDALRAGNGAAEPMIARLYDEARSLADEIRDIMNELRPSILDDFGFPEALRECVASLQAHGDLEISLSVGDDLKIVRPEVNVMLFRVLQESILNVRKHAAARHLDIELARDGGGRVRLRVRDDGRGFDPRGIPRGHLGLLTMRERAEACGGDLEIDSAPGRGTEVRVTVGAEAA